jgi:hypothetical protein
MARTPAKVFFLRTQTTLVTNRSTNDLRPGVRLKMDSDRILANHRNLGEGYVATTLHFSQPSFRGGIALQMRANVQKAESDGGIDQYEDHLREMVILVAAGIVHWRSKVASKFASNYCQKGGLFEQRAYSKLSYKRGCQGKNSPPPLRGDMDVVACIQPRSNPGGVLVLAISVARQTQLMVPIRRFHDAMARRLQFRKATQAKALAKVPTMILCETRGLQLFWVVRGGIGLKRRLPVLNCQTHGAPNNLPDTLPRTRASQEPIGCHRAGNLGTSWVHLTLKLLAASDVRRRNVLPSSKLST